MVQKDHFQHHNEFDRPLKTSEIDDGKLVFYRDKLDTPSQMEARITVKKRRNSKKLKTSSQDEAHEFPLVLEKSDGEHQPNSCRVIKQKCLKATSGVESLQSNTDIKALGQNSAASKPEMVPLVENPVETGKTECGVSLAQEKTKTKNKKKKINVGENKTHTETDGRIVENSPQFPIHGQLETIEKEVTKPETKAGNVSEIKASIMKSEKKRNSQKKCLQEVGEVEAVQSLFGDDRGAGKIEMQKVDNDNNATLSQPDTCTTQKRKVKRKKSALQAGESLAISADSDGHDNEQEISTHRCLTSEENSPTQSRLKASTKKKQGKSKKSMSSSKEQRTEVPSTFPDSGAEVVATKKSNKKKADLNDREPEVSLDSSHVTTAENKSETVECSPTTIKKGKKKRQVSSCEKESMLETEKQPVVEAGSEEHTRTSWQKKAAVKKETGTDKPTTPGMENLTPMKRGKKKRKPQTDEAEMSLNNGLAQEELNGKIESISVSLYSLLWCNTQF